MGYIEGMSEIGHKGAIIGAQYVSPYPYDLIIIKKIFKLSYASFEIRDANGMLLFKVKGKFWSIHDRRVLIDANGNPIALFRSKVRSLHDRWQVFRGESTDPQDLLFTAKKSSIIPFKTTIKVYLQGNTDETSCDFRVQGSRFNRSFTAYAGESNNIIAQVHRKIDAPSSTLNRDNYMITVFPYIDHAFVAALLVLFDGINMADIY